MKLDCSKCKGDGCDFCRPPVNKEPDLNIHVIPVEKLKHYENKDCWCGPTLNQDKDDQHACQIWVHNRVQ